MPEDRKVIMAHNFEFFSFLIKNIIIIIKSKAVEGFINLKILGYIKTNKGVDKISKNVEDKEPIIVIRKASYDLPCENILLAGFEDIIVSGESGIEKKVNGIVLKKEFEIDKVIINVNKSIES